MEIIFILCCLILCFPCIMIILPISCPIITICLIMYFISGDDSTDSSESSDSSKSNTGLFCLGISILCSIVITILILYLYFSKKTSTQRYLLNKAINQNL